MRFTVVWKPTATEELASIWMQAQDRLSITDAAHHIDTLLRADPSNQGESRTENRRILFVPPLGVDFEVHVLDYRVDVLRVWWWPSH